MQENTENPVQAGQLGAAQNESAWEQVAALD